MSFTQYLLGNIQEKEQLKDFAKKIKDLFFVYESVWVLDLLNERSARGNNEYLSSEKKV